MIVSPSVTWPSAAIATLSSRRTSITVVERIRGGFCISNHHKFLISNAQIDTVGKLFEHLVLWQDVHSSVLRCASNTKRDDSISAVIIAMRSTPPALLRFTYL